MEWTPDVSAGDWIRDRLDDGAEWGASMHGVVPRGFEAYARVFHPAWRDRPVGADWPVEPYSHRAWDSFFASHPDLGVVDERVSWAATAAAMALFSFGSGTEADRWQAYVGGSPARTFLSVMTGNASIASISTAGGTIIPGEAFGAAAAIAAADYAVDDSKGALAASTAAGALPAVTRGYVGRRQDGGATGHGLYDLVALWPSRLPDARVQALAVAY